MNSKQQYEEAIAFFKKEIQDMVTSGNINLGYLEVLKMSIKSHQITIDSINRAHLLS